MSDLKATFLKQITSECFPDRVQERDIKEKAFLAMRFHPDNRKLPHNKIALQMEKLPGFEGNCSNSIGTTCQNVVRALVEQYKSEMQADGVDVNGLVNRKKGEKGAWESVYTWLHQDKFPRWLTQEKNRIWQAWKAEAKPDVANISFIEFAGETDCRKIKGCQPRPKEQLQTNQPFSMQIELKSSDYYLLLLNRGRNCNGEETRYLVCPSKAFAPHLQPVSTQFLLPQPDSEFGAIEFDETGTEEYLGILLKEKPNNLDLMTPVAEESLPVWDDNFMYKLLQELERQSGYQFFYQSFEVVKSPSF
jgi:hypothetical protein